MTTVGQIDVTLNGEHAATLSGDEAALLADTLWDLGAATKRRGAIAIAASLKASAHGSVLRLVVNLADGDVPAVREALGGLHAEHGDDAGLESLSDAL